MSKEISRDVNYLTDQLNQTNNKKNQSINGENCLAKEQSQ
jgi:hypothetical protein